MKRTSLGKKSRWLCLAALVSVAGCFQASTVSAQSSPRGSAEQPLPLEQRAKINYDAYILGPGDGLQIELLDLPELSGRFSIGPGGTPAFHAGPLVPRGRRGRLHAGTGR